MSSITNLDIADTMGDNSVDPSIQSGVENEKGFAMGVGNDIEAGKTEKKVI